MEGREYQGALGASGLSFGIVVARFNEFIGERLLDGAVDCLTRHGATMESIAIARVPGGWEIPIALRWMADTKKYDALIAVGCVIRGGTPHFDYVAGEAAKGVAQLQLSSGIPMALGILTTDSIEQAIERAGTKLGNKGFDAALTAIEMANLAKSMR